MNQYLESNDYIDYNFDEHGVGVKVSGKKVEFGYGSGFWSEED